MERDLSMNLIISYYLDKKAIQVIVQADAPKLELKAKCIVISDGEITKFACKYSDFISMQF